MAFGFGTEILLNGINWKGRLNKVHLKFKENLWPNIYDEIITTEFPKPLPTNWTDAHLAYFGDSGCPLLCRLKNISSLKKPKDFNNDFIQIGLLSSGEFFEGFNSMAVYKNFWIQIPITTKKIVNL